MAGASRVPGPGRGIETSRERYRYDRGGHRDLETRGTDRVPKGKGSRFRRGREVGSKGNRRKVAEMAEEDGANKRKRDEAEEENEAGDAFRKQRLKLEKEKVREETRKRRERDRIRTWS